MGADTMAVDPDATSSAAGSEGGPAGASWWAPALVTLASTLIASGFALASLIAPASVVGTRSLGEASRIFAMYAAARSSALTVAVVWNVVGRSRRGLAVLAVVMALVQSGDTLVGIATHDASKAIGPAVLAAATLAGAYLLLRRARSAGSVAAGDRGGAPMRLEDLAAIHSASRARRVGETNEERTPANA